MPHKACRSYALVQNDWSIDMGEAVINTGEDDEEKPPPSRATWVSTMLGKRLVRVWNQKKRLQQQHHLNKRKPLQI
ncbi:hypothetical protein GOP47_0010714 [Adiantum capillus-veneris]|uniref:Uncharacterized protein n=1 Tax=Adiantum capillus-veneris TaxID=13818 RepID=A0A9D4ZGL8_ADICA|nr:hypothetical protein GOP47_0010714 [Adiantum capillus-veneris]